MLFSWSISRGLFWRGGHCVSESRSVSVSVWLLFGWCCGGVSVARVSVSVWLLFGWCCEGVSVARGFGHCFWSCMNACTQVGVSSEEINKKAFTFLKRSRRLFEIDSRCFTERGMMKVSPAVPAHYSHTLMLMSMSFIGQVCLHIRGIYYSDRSTYLLLCLYQKVYTSSILLSILYVVSIQISVYL